MKIIRYIVFIPVCFIALGIIYWGFGLLIEFFLHLSLFWLIIISIFLGGFIWGIFKVISSLLIMLASFISPNQNFSFWTILVLCSINGIWVIINIWTLELQYTFWVIIGAIILTGLVVELTFALIHGALAALEERKN